MDYNILWDPGHGGSDPGACNDDSLQPPLLVQEKDITLSLVNLALEYSDKNYANIKNATTRPDDRFVSLADRVKLCYPTRPTLFFSVHINSRVKEIPEVPGIEFESYYFRELPETSHSAVAAKIVLDILEKKVAASGEKIVNRGVKTAGFFTLRATPCPSILIEAGFESDKDDVLWFSDEENRKIIAAGLVDGLVAYLEGNGCTVERWN